MNKIIQKKVDLNVILTVLIGAQFCHQGWGTREKLHIRGYSRLIWYFFKHFQTIISPILFRFGLRTSKSNTTTA